jgi:hypothetical protein
LDEVTEAGIVARPVTPFADLGLYERHDMQRLLRDAISAVGEDLPFEDLVDWLAEPRSSISAGHDIPREASSYSIVLILSNLNIPVKRDRGSTQLTTEL